MSRPVPQRSSRGAQSGMWSIDLRWRREAESDQCHAIAEASGGACQAGVGVRRGLKDRRVRGQTGIVARHGW